MLEQVSTAGGGEAPATTASGCPVRGVVQRLETFAADLQTFVTSPARAARSCPQHRIQRAPVLRPRACRAAEDPDTEETWIRSCPRRSRRQRLLRASALCCRKVQSVSRTAALILPRRALAPASSVVMTGRIPLIDPSQPVSEPLNTNGMIAFPVSRSYWADEPAISVNARMPARTSA